MSFHHLENPKLLFVCCFALLRLKGFTASKKASKWFFIEVATILRMSNIAMSLSPEQIQEIAVQVDFEPEVFSIIRFRISYILEETGVNSILV